MRLSTNDVSILLKRGKRLRPAVLGVAKVYVDARVLSHTVLAVVVARMANPTTTVPPKMSARIAIAVPKRFLKKAVDRNLVKRWFREALRLHAARTVSADMLLTLIAKVKVNDSSEKAHLKLQINDLLAGIEARSLPSETRERN